MLIRPRKRRTVSPCTQHLLALLGFVGLFGILYHPILAGTASLKTNFIWPPGPLFVQDPTAGGATSLPYEQLVNIAWQHLWWPAWDPYQGYGLPLWASQSNAFFLPEILAHFLFSNNYSVWNLLRILLMAFGAYLWVRSLEQGPIASFVVGVVYALSGPTPTNINLDFLNPLLVLPYLLLSLNHLMIPRTSNRRNVRALLELVTTVTFLAISGFVEVLPLLLILVLIYLASILFQCETWHAYLRRAALACVAAGIGAIIGNMGLLPVLAAVTQGMANNTNSASSYLTAVQPFWLATLFEPGINGPSMVTASGQTVWTLGTPFLGLAILLSLIAAIRYDRPALWYVAPSAAMSVLGILAYADIGGILQVFSFFPFDHVIMVRFLAFAWWLPLSALIGYTLSSARKFHLSDLLVALVMAATSDLLLARLFTDAIHAWRLRISIQNVDSALRLAIIAALLLIIGILATRWLGTSIIASAVVVVFTLIVLPRNFFPSGGNSIASSIRGPDMQSSRILVMQQGFLQLPTRTNSMQIEGPINPNPYLSVIDDLIPSSDVTKGGSATNDIGQPTLAFVRLNRITLNALAQLGVDRIVAGSVLQRVNGVIAGRSCDTRLIEQADQEGICLLGKGIMEGAVPEAIAYIYKLPGVDSLVAPAVRIRFVTDNLIALQLIGDMLHHGETLRNTMFITGRYSGRTLAMDARGIGRYATTQYVLVNLRSSSSGLVVLRDTYLPGMTCFANNARVPCFPADGGVWTAVAVPSGYSSVRLDYINPTDLWGAILTTSGEVILCLGWLVWGGGVLIRRLQGAWSRYMAEAGATNRN